MRLRNLLLSFSILWASSFVIYQDAEAVSKSNKIKKVSRITQDFSKSRAKRIQKLVSSNVTTKRAMGEIPVETTATMNVKSSITLMDHVITSSFGQDSQVLLIVHADK